MKDFGGLQIDVRCFKCDRLPTADVVLFEMRNHLYICTFCRQEAEEKGKQIAWVDNTVQQAHPQTTPQQTKTQSLQSRLPENSLFAQLELPLTTTVAEIEEAIKQKMLQWRRSPNSAEKREIIERLHEWQEKIEDTDAFEAYRESLKPKPKENNGLSVGGRKVVTIKEFVEACEASREGWADGERYLRNGKLKQWILYNVDRTFASAMGYYQAWTQVSDFRALNEALYWLLAERPFRLYSKEEWQFPRSVTSAATAEELATLCDLYWRIGEDHLYNGSLVFWLEHRQHIEGLSEYYKSSLAMYANAGVDRGVGLELLLQRAVPTLEKPKLRVTFDGTEGQYSVKSWDREIQHKPVALTVTNETRGFTAIKLELAADSEPSWIALSPASPFYASGRPGANMPITAMLNFRNLPQLWRGVKYEQKITLSMRGEAKKSIEVAKFPITLKTMHFFQGLRGILWRFGLRGGLPGLVWNGLIGSLLGFLSSALILAIISRSFTADYSGGTPAPNVVIMALRLIVSTCGIILTQVTPFPLLIGAITGLTGFFIGYGKGHSDYKEGQGASSFRKWTFWLALLVAGGMLARTYTETFIGELISNNKSINVINVVEVLGVYMSLFLLILVLAWMIVSIRVRLEKSLRVRMAHLLNPPGKA